MKDFMNTIIICFTIILVGIAFDKIHNNSTKINNLNEKVEVIKESCSCKK